jgi:tetratricopeptide (TPR) repeat protein
LHDLLREYAAALAADLPSADRRAAVVAVLDFQVHAIAASVPVALRATTQRDLRLGPPLRADLAAADDDPAARVERERPNLAGFIDAGMAAGRPELAWRLPRAAWRHLWSRGYVDDIARLQERAMQIAAAAGDRAAEATSANYLGSAHWRRGRHADALRAVECCIRIRRDLGDDIGVGQALGNLSGIYESIGKYLEAAEVASQGLDVLRGGDDPHQMAMLLNNRAMALGQLGQYDEAMRVQRRRLMVLVELGDGTGIGNSLLHLVNIKRRAGRLRMDVAFREVGAALRLYRLGSFLFGQADARNELAVLLRLTGRYAEAMVEHRASVDMMRTNGDLRFEAQFLNETAHTQHAAGDDVAAGESHARALRIAHGIGAPHEQAVAHLGLGDCLAVSDPRAADQHWRQALEMFTRMGAPERAIAAERLADA